MGSYGLIRHADIRAALEECAPGYEWDDSRDHYIHISWKGKKYPSIPKPHGKLSGRTEIEKGHVKKMFRFFGILECAKKLIENL